MSIRRGEVYNVWGHRTTDMPVIVNMQVHETMDGTVSNWQGTLDARIYKLGDATNGIYYPSDSTNYYTAARLYTDTTGTQLGFRYSPAWDGTHGHRHGLQLHSGTYSPEIIVNIKNYMDQT